MAKAKQERSSDRSRRILDEALLIVGQRGYYGFSIKEVAERCDLTVPGVLHHFPSKDQILISLLRDRDERDTRELTALFSGKTAAVDTLSMAEVKGVLHQIVAWNQERPELVRLYSMLRTEALYADHPAHVYFNDRDRRVITGLEELVTSHVADPRSAARQLLAGMGGLEELWLRDLENVDLVAEWDAMAELLLPEAS